MRVVVISGREEVYRGEAEMAILPGRDGEITVLDFHQAFLYRLRNGRVKITPQTAKGGRQADGEDAGEVVIEIKDGLARFDMNDLAVLCEPAAGKK